MKKKKPICLGCYRNLSDKHFREELPPPKFKLKTCSRCGYTTTYGLKA